MEIETNELTSGFSLSLASTQLSRDSDVRFFIGLPNTNVFKALYDYLQSKACNMQYWKGPRQTIAEAPIRYSVDDNHDNETNYVKPGHLEN